MSVLIDMYVEATQVLVPGLKVVRKKDSKLMRFFGKLLFFLPGFMETYTTVLGKTVYAPDSLWNGESVGHVMTLAHETQHAWDEIRLGRIVYKFLYLAPQILVPLALLSILAIWFGGVWLWWLAALVLLAPLPAWGRMYIERRGYLITLACRWWLYGEDNATRACAHVITYFKGPAYYFMWPFEKSLQRWLLRRMREVVYDPKSGGPVAKHAHRFIEVYKKVAKQADARKIKSK